MAVLQLGDDGRPRTTGGMLRPMLSFADLHKRNASGDKSERELEPFLKFRAGNGHVTPEYLRRVHQIIRLKWSSCSWATTGGPGQLEACSAPCSRSRTLTRPGPRPLRMPHGRSLLAAGHVRALATWWKSLWWQVGLYAPTAGAYRGTSLARRRAPLGPYCRPMPRVLWGS